jgi:hypothetical protein
VSKEHRALGNAQAEFAATMNLAEAYHGRGNTARAIDVSRTLIKLRNRVSTDSYANALANRAGYCLALDDLAEGHAALREMIASIGARDPERPLVATGIEHFALACALDHDFTRAARLAGYTDAVFQRLGFVREFTEKVSRDRLVAILEANVAPDELTRLTDEGAALAPEAAVGLSLENP